MIFSNHFLFEILEVLVALVVVFLAYVKWSHQYWKKKGVPFIQPSVPFGNLPTPFDKTLKGIGVHMLDLYNKMKDRGLKHAGIYFFATPIYVVVNLDYVKNIMAKDFKYFMNRGNYYNEKDDPLSAHLFSIGGVKWRNLRTKLTPTFTSGKLKAMFQTLVDCEGSLHQVLDKFYENREPIDVKEISGRFTTDIIGSCAFGLDCNSFQNETSPFREYGKKVFVMSKLRRLFLNFALSFPQAAKAFHVTIIPKDVSKFFMKVVNDTVSYRENNNIVRKDFLQLLMELRNNKLSEEIGFQHDGRTMTMDEVAAQSFVFFLAGFETSSTTMTFTMYELARNEDIQDKVRKEINEVLAKYDGKITYDAINDMKYMNQVIEETLRKYPPVPFVTRECVKDYKVPDADLIIEKGMRVIIPIYGIHYDERYHPNPDKFDPDRFNEQNKPKMPQYSHMPFGEGPRICIGMRFGLMQTKVGLTSMLKNYKFTVNKKTQEPLKMNPNSFILAVEGDVWLDAQKI